MNSIARMAGRLFIWLCVIVPFSFSWPVFAAAVPPEVAAAAEEGLSPFLKVIPPPERENYGFAPGDDLEKAALGEPFPLYTITPQTLFNSASGSPVSSLISSAGSWFFPVLVNGEARNILTVDQMAGSWKAVAIGKAALARELQKVREQWPEAKGYEPKLVAVFQATAYFFTVPEKDDYNLTPLTFDGKGFDAGVPLEKGYAKTVELSRFIDKLKAAVEENILKNSF